MTRVEERGDHRAGVVPRDDKSGRLMPSFKELGRSEASAADGRAAPRLGERLGFPAVVVSALESEA